MKNRSVFEKLGDLVLGKGFYIVLFLCVATIGISGYYLIRSMNGQPENLEPAGGSPSVVLPDSEANGPDPAGTPAPNTGLDSQTAGQAHVEVPEPADDPQPVKEPAQDPAVQEPEPPKTEKPAVVYTWPVKGEVLRDFSVETLSPDPTLGDWRTHGGMDIAASLGTSVLAMCPGTVSQLYEDGLMGTTVVIDHGDGLSSTYCSLAAQPTVEVGEEVETGTVIGTVGSTAIAESGMVSHLHLQVSLNGQPVDPEEYLPQR